jgi:hypothetical protein
VSNLKALLSRFNWPPTAHGPNYLTGWRTCFRPRTAFAVWLRCRMAGLALSSGRQRDRLRLRHRRRASPDYTRYYHLLEYDPYTEYAPGC